MRAGFTVSTPGHGGYRRDMMITDVDRAVTELAALIEASERMLLFTGAGISTASGIPDYRGPHGVWKTRRPVFYDEFMGSAEDRVRYWQQKLEDHQAHGDVEPNAVHESIVLLERAGMLEAVVTQNVDGLHSAAGTSDDLLVELHGTVRSVECQSCGARSSPEAAFGSFEATGDPPACDCGGYLKPATISFGQALRSADLERAARAAEVCDLVLALGSTLSVTPAALVPLTAAERGVPYVIVNRGATEHDRLGYVTLRIEGDVSAVFPAAVADALSRSARPAGE
jgi:NAD-dependent deacetylase